MAKLIEIGDFIPVNGNVQITGWRYEPAAEPRAEAVLTITADDRVLVGGADGVEIVPWTEKYREAHGKAAAWRKVNDPRT